MGNFTFDVKKAKGTSDATQSDHIERKVIPHNADPTRTHLNMALVTYPDGVNGRDEAIAYRLKTAGIKRKITNDQVRVVRIVMSGTHEDMMAIYKMVSSENGVKTAYDTCTIHSVGRMWFRLICIWTRKRHISTHRLYLS